MTTPAEVNTTPNIKVEPKFGTGRYSPLMEEIYKDAQNIFKITPKHAEKLARQIASDIGAYMAKAPVEVTLRKSGKDGKLTIREASKLKGVTMTYALHVMMAINFANDAVAHGFNRNDTKWSLTESLAESLAEFDTE